MNLKKIAVFMVALVTIMLLLLIGDAIVAGIISFVALLFNGLYVCAILFKWITVGLFLIELPFVVICLYNNVNKDEDLRKDDYNIGT